MRKAARTLTAGVATAITLLPLLGGVATSQESQALNGQVQLGDVSASQTLDVELVEEYTAAVTTATGNSYSAAVQAGSLDVQSSQSMQGATNASTLLNVAPGADTGFTTSLVTAATANAGDASVLSGGALTGTFVQDVGTGPVTATSWTEAAASSAGDLTSTAQAIGNTQGIGAVGGSIDVAITQRSQSNVQASDGAMLRYTPGTANWNALAVANNVTSTGTAGSEHTLQASQTHTSDVVQASTFVGVGNGQFLVNTATASANNISAGNEFASLNVTTTQDNDSTVNAVAETQVALFGSSSVMASGVGNTLLAAENGGEVFVDSSQTNDGGGVFASASSIGGDGYDISATSTAMGNAVTGFSCSACGGRMTVRNSQTNRSNVGASSNVRTSDVTRSVSGVATAVGNSGNFYVSQPEDE